MDDNVILISEFFNGKLEIISRSEGKRLNKYMEEYSVVYLCYNDIMEIGQGFADQVYRLDKTVKLNLNVTKEVYDMIDRATDCHWTQNIEEE